MAKTISLRVSDAMYRDILTQQDKAALPTPSAAARYLLSLGLDTASNISPSTQSLANTLALELFGDLRAKLLEVLSRIATQYRPGERSPSTEIVADQPAVHSDPPNFPRPQLSGISDDW